MASGTTSPDNLGKIFKAYDVRGIVGERKAIGCSPCPHT